MQYLIMALIGIIFVIWMFRYDKSHPNQIKKSNGKVQKPLHKRWWTWTIAVILIVGGLGNAMGLAADDDDDSASVARTESKTKREKPKNKKSVSHKKNSKKQSFSTEDKEAAALLMLKQNFKGKAKVWYDADNKAFMIQPTSDEFKEELLDVVATQNTDDWTNLTNSMDKLSRSLYKNLGLVDFVSIVNPDNPDKVLYSSLNGESKYDFLKDN